jgi:hypothetical protein
MEWIEIIIQESEFRSQNSGFESAESARQPLAVPAPEA